MGNTLRHPEFRKLFFIFRYQQIYRSISEPEVSVSNSNLWIFSRLEFIVCSVLTLSELVVCLCSPIFKIPKCHNCARILVKKFFVIFYKKYSFFFLLPKKLLPISIIYFYSLAMKVLCPGKA